ncbi:DUF3179 domain-containing protein [Halalkalicoccus ordinarius]|uniref:DUF3179 domain-containing protein n=1 Tax=Halalkalicoccus ordinarius TaxID=3116651 RepID=UPI00300EBFFF
MSDRIPNRRLDRRRFLAGVGIAALAGCTGSGGTRDEPRDADGDGAANGDPSDTDEELPGTEGEPPTREPKVELADELAAFERNARSSGVDQDGIPAIDDPAIDDAEGGDGLMEPGDVVFGVELDGKARAYPQHVLVWHEIVNDELGGTPISVTYCPLTGTAIGYERGSTTFGVSGDLVNSNLIMYDRGTESRWPQVLRTAIDGPLEGRALREFPITWTTWGRWREAHPGTTAVTERTGYARDYGNDPYGSYGPRSGYYADGDSMFGVMNEDDRLDPKEVVIGMRGADGPIAFGKERLRSEGLIEGDVGGTPYLIAHDPTLDTGYVYRNPDDGDVSIDGEGSYAVGDERYDPDGFPLERVNAFDAMWFAWAGFYPDSALQA